MPYVQRDFGGHVTGLFSVKQPGHAEELLPDDHPEVVAYREKHPIPPELLKPPTKEEIQSSRREHESNERELKELDAAVVHHMKLWSHLETALSALLYEILHIQPRSSLIPYVIYYSPDGFDARQKIVVRVLQRFIRENPKCVVLKRHWETINNELQKAKDIRNKVAHGAPLILGIRGNKYIRHSPPAFDVRLVGELIPTGTIPGLSVEEIKKANQKINKLAECIDDTNRAIAAFHQFGPDTLQKSLPPLDANLQALQSLNSGGQTQEGEENRDIQGL